MTGGMAFVYDPKKEFEKRVNPETVIWQTIETEFWIKYLKNLIHEHLKETNSLLSKKILEKFNEEIKNFVQICPKEMVEKLKNPLSLDSKFKKVI